MKLKNIPFMKIFNLFIFLIFILSIASMIYYTYLFDAGFHNFDIAQNLESMQYDMNYKLCEYGIDNIFDYHETLIGSGSRISLHDTYLKGLHQIYRSFFIMMLSTAIFGVSLAYFMIRR